MERPGADTPELAVLDRSAMLRNVLSGFQYSDNAAERASTEAYEFDVPSSGIVVVSNLDHDSAHAVTVSDGVPVSCSCKADEYQSGACKHRVAVAHAEPVREAASVDPDDTRAMADGGTVVSVSQPPELDASEGCPHGNAEFCDVGTGKERPEMCWDCFEVSRQ